jgi:protein gp37
VRELRDLCVSQNIAFFFKQWGGRTPKAGGRELDGRTWDEYPKPELMRGSTVFDGESSLSLPLIVT